MDVNEESVCLFMANLHMTGKQILKNRVSTVNLHFRLQEMVEKWLKFT